MKMQPTIFETALRYLELGYSPIPIVAGQKRAAIKWKQWQDIRPGRREIDEWFSVADANMALVTGNGVVVVDIDDPGLLEIVIERCGDTSMRCQTPSGGMHLYYAMRRGVHYGNAVRIKDKPLDLRCEGAYVVCPPSRNEQGVPYQWTGEVIPIGELPPINVSWLRAKKRRAVAPLVENLGTGNMVRRARGYLANIEGAISGQRGHDRTFRVACVLMLKFGLSLEESLPLIREWNEQCEPMWSEKDLRHKLQDAQKLRFRFGKR